MENFCTDSRYIYFRLIDRLQQLSQSAVMTHTHADKTWSQLYGMMREASPEPKVVKRTPRLDLVDYALADLVDPNQTIAVYCNSQRCHQMTSFTAEQLMDLLGEQATFADMERRMTCAKCGQLMAGLRMIWSRAGTK